MTLIKPVNRAKLTKNGYEYVVRGRKVWFQQHIKWEIPIIESWHDCTLFWAIVDAKTGYIFASGFPSKKNMRDKTYSAVVKTARKATRLNLTLSKYLKNANTNQSN